MADNPYGLRIASPDDGEALLQFVLPIFAEDAAQTVSVSKVHSLVERCVTQQSALAGVVCSADGTIEASVGATLDEFDYTDERHMMIRWLGVAPAFRRTDRAARMVSYVRWLYETMLANSDVPIPVFVPTLTTVEHARKVNLYQRRLPPVGTLFALGCLPERSFASPRAGVGSSGGKDSTKVATLARVPTASPVTG